MKILSNILLSLMVVLSGTGIISCSEYREEVGEMTEDAQVTFTATLLDEVNTRAFGDGLKVNTLVVGIFNEELVMIERKDFPIESLSINVLLTLAKNQTYNFIFWAYNRDSQVYNIDEEGSKLTEIKMKHEINGFTQAENADAFFATVKNFAVMANTVKEVELIRPLAQINVGTSGTAAKASFTISNTSDTFHPFTEMLSGEANFTWTFADTTTETFTVKMNDTLYTYNYLALGYLFAPLGDETAAAKKSCQLKLTETDKEIPPFQDVELHSNRRSNIGGCFTE